MNRMPGSDSGVRAALLIHWSAILGASFMRQTIRSALAGFAVLFVLGGCSNPAPRSAPVESQVLFVCEHGNVKSLMAASYFNKIAGERRLPYRAVSRGVAPDSTTVPPAIMARLQGEGFDVAEYHPLAVSAADVSASRRVILINTVLPEDARSSGNPIEQWVDVPPASSDYAAASAALKSHVEKLIEDLRHSEAR